MNYIGNLHPAVLGTICTATTILCVFLLINAITINEQMLGRRNKKQIAMLILMSGPVGWVVASVVVPVTYSYRLFYWVIKELR